MNRTQRNAIKRIVVRNVLGKVISTKDNIADGITLIRGKRLKL